MGAGATQTEPPTAARKSSMYREDRRHRSPAPSRWASKKCLLDQVLNYEVTNPKEPTYQLAPRSRQPQLSKESPT